LLPLFAVGVNGSYGIESEEGEGEGGESGKTRYRKRSVEQGFSSRHTTSKYISYTVNSII